MYSIHLKCIQSILLIKSNKNDTAFAIELFCNLNPADSREHHIQKNNIIGILFF